MAWTPSPAALAAITACVVAAGAGAGILLQPTKDRAAPVTQGPGVNIAVVAPTEPSPDPGGVMDVGDLADSYTHRGHVQPDTVDIRPYDASEGGPPVRVEPRRVERARVLVPEPAPPVVAERREPPRRPSFGFDQPRPDYAAERRARAARLDDQRRFEEARRSERFDDRDDYSEPRDDRGRDAGPDRDRGGRERQWYRSDGSRASGPDPLD